MLVNKIWSYKCGQVVEVISSEEEIDPEKWKIPEEEEDREEFWGFEDLECECEYECNTSSSSNSQHDDSISTGSSYNRRKECY